LMFSLRHDSGEYVENYQNNHSRYILRGCLPLHTIFIRDGIFYLLFHMSC
jgi:hypothetical protein